MSSLIIETESRETSLEKWMNLVSDHRDRIERNLSDCRRKFLFQRLEMLPSSELHRVPLLLPPNSQPHSSLQFLISPSPPPPPWMCADLTGLPEHQIMRAAKSQLRAERGSKTCFERRIKWQTAAVHNKSQIDFGSSLIQMPAGFRR